MRIGTLIFALSLPVFAQEAAPAQKNAIPAEPTEAAYPALERFINVMEMTKARHPDVEKLSYDQLINQALDGMLSSLDPHSSFIHPEMQEMMDKDGKLNNEVASLGLSLGKNSEQLYLSAIEANGPAALAKHESPPNQQTGRIEVILENRTRITCRQRRSNRPTPRSRPNQAR
jgi:C-terminal processing protease CtpA/Prc